MNTQKNKGEPQTGGVLGVNAANPKKPLATQEKTKLGGRHNSGVTSDDPKVKNEIEKQATMRSTQPPADGKRK